MKKTKELKLEIDDLFDRPIQELSSEEVERLTEATTLELEDLDDCSADWDERDCARRKELLHALKELYKEEETRSRARKQTDIVL